MKTLTFILCLFISTSIFGQEINLDGAYLAKSDDTHTLWLFKNGYSSKIIYKDQQYISTQGGPYRFDGKKLQITWEYNDAHPQSVGTMTNAPTSADNSALTVEGTTFQKQLAKKQDLDGVWRITGRQNAEKKTSTIARGDRKTIKILVDGYFQWIAINPVQKGFYGTGGGKYTFANNDYTENIVFFSRDNSRVGANLKFKGEIKDRDWHHSGLSSKGDPIYEIWSLE